MKTALPLSAAALLFGSCNLAPKYSVPSAPTSAEFKETGGSPGGRNMGWVRAQPKDDALRAKWWDIYGDPVLNGLEEQVQVSNQTIKADEAAYRQAAALVVEARASLFPTAAVSPSYTKYRSSSTLSGSAVSASEGQAGGTGTSSSSSTGGASGSGGQIYSLPFQASYEVDSSGPDRNTVAASAANAQASAADLANALLSMQAQVAEDYFQVRALDEEQNVLNSTVKTYREDLQLTQTLFKYGIDSDEDVAQAQSQLDGAVALATDVGTSRAQYEHAIAVLIGNAPANFSLAASEFDPVPPPVPLAMPSQLLERRPDIAAAERAVAAANAQIGVARAAYFPSLTLSGTGGFESPSLSQWLSWPSRFWSIGPEASETLIDFGLRRGQTEAARAAYDQAVANYRETVLSAFQSVEDNLADLRILATETEQRKIAASSTRRYVNLSLTRFKQGIDSYLNVATAQSAYLSDQENLVTTELRQMTASVSLVMALGGGWEVSDLPKPWDR